MDLTLFLESETLFPKVTNLTDKLWWYNHLSMEGKRELGHPSSWGHKYGRSEYGVTGPQWQNHFLQTKSWQSIHNMAVMCLARSSPLKHWKE